MITHDGESYIHGNILKKNEDYFFINDSKYTTCSHPDPHFYIKAKKIKVIPNEKIISGSLLTPLSFLLTLSLN